jgi:hypothetical protein
MNRRDDGSSQESFSETQMIEVYCSVARAVGRAVALALLDERYREDERQTPFYQKARQAILDAATN